MPEVHLNLDHSIGAAIERFGRWTGDVADDSGNAQKYYRKVMAIAMTRRLLQRLDQQDVVGAMSPKELSAFIEHPFIAASCFFLSRQQMGQYYDSLFDEAVRHAKGACEADSTASIDYFGVMRLLGSEPGQWTPRRAETEPFGRHARELIRRAMLLLSDPRFNCQALVEENTRMVVPRPNATLGSSSTLAFPGRVVLFIPDSGCNDFMLAENILHEAMHTYLYKIEALSPWFVTDEPWNVKLVSPWTGNILTAHAFLHACFIWFGLLHFWLVAQSKALDDNFVHLQIERCAKGFFGGIADSARSIHGVKATLVDACGELEGRVRTLVS